MGRETARAAGYGMERTVQVLEEVERRVGSGLHDELGVAHGGDEQYDGHEAHLSCHRQVYAVVQMQELVVVKSVVYTICYAGQAESKEVAHHQIAGDRETHEARRE